MQSIYRFREAKVALFLQALGARASAACALEPLTLTTNFRSQAGLVDWFNAAFPHILPREADTASGAVPYSPATPHPDAPRGGAAVTWHHFTSRQARSAHASSSSSRHAEGTKAILVRNRLALAEIVPALKAAGIRFRAIEIEQLGEKQVVQDLYALTRALLHLGDRIAWLSLLRAPWSACPLEQAAARSPADSEPLQDRLGADQGRPLPRRLHPHPRPRASPTASAAACAIASKAPGSPSAAPPASPTRPSSRTPSATSTSWRSSKTPARSPTSPPADTLERLYALPDVDATDDDLQIMTIHKAKGLEFGTVIVPGLDRDLAVASPTCLLFNEMVPVRPPDKGGSEPPASGGLLLAPIKATGAETDPTYRYLRDLNADAEDVESSRLLYVAATRAEKRLHLLACLGCDKDGELKKPGRAHRCSRALGPSPSRISRAEAAAARSRRTRAHRTSRYLPAFRARLAHQSRLRNPCAGRRRRKGARNRRSSSRGLAKQRATSARSSITGCRRIADDDMRGWDAKRVETPASAVRAGAGAPRHPALAIERGG